MSSDKTTLMRAFNNTFFQFLNEVHILFPDNNDIKDAIVGLELLKKANPTCIIKAWQFYVYEPYKEQISTGDITFFCEKDYNNDLVYLSNAEEIMKAIQRIRNPIKSLSEENKQIAFKYVSNLCTLSNTYSTIIP
jgi:hypothetical protein